MSASQIGAALRGWDYGYATEIELHRGLQQAMRLAGYDPQPEHLLDGAGRVDFYVDDGEHATAVEVKVAGSPEAVARQLGRYAAHADVDDVLLVTTRVRHRNVPNELHGKTVHVLLIRSRR